MTLLLADVVAASGAVAATRSRTAKRAALAELLTRAEPGEVAPVVAWLSGELTQRQVGVGWAALRDAAARGPGEDAALAGGDAALAGDASAAEPADALTVLAVEEALTALGAHGGAGSQAARRADVRSLFDRAGAAERDFLLALLGGGLRQGALTGVMTDAVAEAAAVPVASVRRALTLHGDLAAIAGLALDGGEAALAGVRLEVGRPLSPMLAGTAPDVAAAVDGPAAVDWKVDGARVQLHRDGDAVRVFTRTLDDVTARLPELVAFARGLEATAFVLDAEAIALRPDRRPEPFQVTAARFGSLSGEPLTILAFDVLHLDGEDLLDRPLEERIAALEQLVPPAARVPRRVCQDAVQAQGVFDEAVAAGFEGVVVKALDAPYAAGRRGAGWVKVKPVHTLDLVVLAAEWGSGRRRGKLSNLWLGARDGEGFAMVGKTFKGLTDELLAWQTEALLALRTEQAGHVVHVRPELVVEVAIDGVQTSTRYGAGAALRFARVRRYREDKAAAEADTIELVLRLRDGGAPVT